MPDWKSCLVWPLLAVSASCSSASGGPPVSAAPVRIVQDDAAAEAAFSAFESGQVRPLALSSDGSHLYATNTPDNRLEIFDRSSDTLKAVGSVMTGLEPVAVSVQSETRVWVVNHLSDSVSVVDVSDPMHPYVVRTLLVGDEPRDIVFAGTDHKRAFITTAHRGQNTGRDPQLFVPGVGRADVWVFDADDLGEGLYGTPLTVITLFADTPRALAVSPDAQTVYAAGFYSGNRTSSISMRYVIQNESDDGSGMPPPRTNVQGDVQPFTGLIVKQRFDPRSKDAKLRWTDASGQHWDDLLPFNLPDKDVFAIDASADPPAPKAAGEFSGVGTVLFNIAVNGKSGKLYVSNTDARNDIRFEGHNVYGPTQGATTGSVRGHIVENRITVIDPASGAVAPRHINKHIDYSQDGNPDEADRSLSQPCGMVVSDDGATLYVAALGSDKIGVFSTSALEDDSFVPSRDAQIDITGGGPTGVVLDDASHRLFVMTRFDDGISVIDVAKRKEIQHVAMFNPEPKRLVRGRHFLYDARNSSGHGDTSCGSCHVFGDFDGLAWDLGDPDGMTKPVPGPFAVDESILRQTFEDATAMGTPGLPGLPPMAHLSVKGPMTTQSLRGLANHGPMHWRGERTAGLDDMGNVLSSAQPDTGSFDEHGAFEKFTVAFDGLLGRTEKFPDDDMSAFADFALQLMYPPNPLRNLDNSLNEQQQAGRDFFFQHTPDGKEIPADSHHNCNGCHTLDPNGNAEFGVSKPGFFGSSGQYMLEPTTQLFKVPHLRNQYQKVGRFSSEGDQVRGFGFLHDGSFDTVAQFLLDSRFVAHQATPLLPANPGGFPPVDKNETDPDKLQAQRVANYAARHKVETFALVFDSNLAPVVGQQATLSRDDASGEIQDRIDLFEARAKAGDCELVVKAAIGSQTRGFLYDPDKQVFISDNGKPPISDQALRELSKQGYVTFTAVPPKSGRRIGLDRDMDGVLDGQP